MKNKNMIEITQLKKMNSMSWRNSLQTKTTAITVRHC
jgi:hypothetical protein